MNNPKISVIIPVYNVESYLRECLDSVVNQTFHDIEIICINDGSTDGSQAILEEYAAKDSRIITFYQANAGQATARNNALDIAKGEYIIFVDSDDIISPETIKKTYNAAKESGSELVMFYLYWDNPNFPIVINAPCDISKPVEDLLSKTKLAFFQGAGPCKWLWEKALIDRLNLRFPEGIKFEDVPFVLNAALHSNSITVVPSQFYYWRLHVGSTTRQKNDFYCRYVCLSYQYALESVQDFHLSDECLQVIYRQKLILIWVGYYKWTPRELLGQFRNNIRNSAFPHEYEWIKNNKLCLSHSQRFFYFGIYGNRIAQTVMFFKILKESFADWLAKKIAPHSPWLQQTLESVDNQRKLIQDQQEQLNNYNK